MVHLWQIRRPEERCNAKLLLPNTFYCNRFRSRLNPEAKDEILYKLIHYGFLNEERFVYSFVRGKVNQKLWGRNRLRQELKMRQIDGKLIDKAFKEEIDPEHYWNNLVRLAQKKYDALYSERESFKKMNKIKAYLAYKGYEFDLIHEAIHFINKEY